MAQAALIAAIRMPGRPQPSGFESCLYSNPFRLEVELQGQLNQAWLFGSYDAAEIRTVSCVPVRIVELRVIEQVEEFGAEFETLALSNRKHLV